MFFYSTMDSPLGALKLYCSDIGLAAVLFDSSPNPERWFQSSAFPGDRHPVILQAIEELTGYFRLDRKNFTVPLDTSRGTAFQKEVWVSLLKIAYGEVISYSEQARKLVGREKAVRAVAAANGQNPISIVVPCHRVIGKDGGLRGYGGGLQNKERLLAMESTISRRVTAGSLEAPGRLFLA